MVLLGLCYLLLALAFALRPGGPGWAAGFLAVALGGAAS